MIDYLIKVENKFVGDAFALFVDNYKEHIATFLNNVLKNETGSADAFISKDENGVIQMYQTAPDKGIVLGQPEANGPVDVWKYVDLPVDSKYIIYDGQHLALFLKQAEGVSDIKIGRFANFNDVFTQIDSDSVRDTIQTVKSAIKNAEVERKKVEKAAAKQRKLLTAGTKND